MMISTDLNSQVGTDNPCDEEVKGRFSIQERKKKDGNGQITNFSQKRPQQPVSYSRQEHTGGLHLVVGQSSRQQRMVWQRTLVKRKRKRTKVVEAEKGRMLCGFQRLLVVMR